MNLRLCSVFGGGSVLLGSLLLLLPTAACGLAVDDDVGDDDVGDDDSGDDDAGDDDSQVLLEAESGVLLATNSAGRSGWYYLPPRADGAPVPYLVAFHGTGGDGQSIGAAFQALAEVRGFAIVAPDSRVSPQGQYMWEVGTEPGEVTPDLTHAITCLDEVLARGDAPLDAGHLLAAGFSGGASSAPYLATNDARFTALAILHGGMFEGGFGPNQPRAWLSTGEDDTARPPGELSQYALLLGTLGFPEVEFRTYPGGHELGEAERGELIAWWLDGARR